MYYCLFSGCRRSPELFTLLAIDDKNTFSVKILSLILSQHQYLLNPAVNLVLVPYPIAVFAPTPCSAKHSRS